MSNGFSMKVPIYFSAILLFGILGDVVADDVNDNQDVEKKLLELVEVYDRKYPGNSLEKIIPFEKAAEVYRQIGQPEKAIPLYEAMASIYKSNNSENVNELIGVLVNLSTVYAVVGRFEDAMESVYEYYQLLINLRVPSF